MWLLAIGCTGIDGKVPGDSAAVVETDTPGETGAGEETAEPVLASNLLLVSVDTLRRDRLGWWDGSDRTPALDALLADALVLDEHHSCSNWTFPGLVCAMGATDLEGSGFTPVGGNVADPGKVPDDFLLVAEHLSDAGFATGVAAATPFITGARGTLQGFDIVEQSSGWSAPEVAQAALEVADQLAASERWMLHVHFLDPHSPYDPDEAFFDPTGLPDVEWDLTDKDVLRQVTNDYKTYDAETQAAVDAWLAALYNAEVAWTDHELGTLVGGLRERGLLDDTVVVLFSDHGEQFFENGGQGHRVSLHHGENLALGAVWHPAGLPHEVWERPTTHADLVPTALAQLGVEPMPGTSGKAVGTRADDDPIFAWALLGSRTVQAVQVGDERLHYHWKGGLELFDRAADPTEQVDLSREQAGRAQELYELLAERIALLDADYDEYVPTEP